MKAFALRFTHAVKPCMGKKSGTRRRNSNDDVMRLTVIRKPTLKHERTNQTGPFAQPQQTPNVLRAVEPNLRRRREAHRGHAVATNVPPS
jgi:hypothetical protein